MNCKNEQFKRILIQLKKGSSNAPKEEQGIFEKTLKRSKA